EHGLHAGARLAERADGLGFTGGGADLLDRFLLGGFVLVVGPFAQADQVLLEAGDRVAQRPLLVFVAGAIAAGIVRGRVRGAAIGEQFDDRRALVGAGALLGPLGRGPDGQEVVAVDAQRGQAIADALGGEGGLQPAGDALEG